MAGNNQLNNGDWVQGRSRDGELIHGYIETVSANREIVKVNVVESDNKKRSGNRFRFRVNGLKSCLI